MQPPILGEPVLVSNSGWQPPTLFALLISHILELSYPTPEAGILSPTSHSLISPFAQTLVGR